MVKKKALPERIIGRFKALYSAGPINHRCTPVFTVSTIYTVIYLYSIVLLASEL